MSVIIGMDPHKRSATIEVVDEKAVVLAAGRFGTDKAGYAGMLAAGRKFAHRTWAAGGCNGVGRHIAHRLVHDGETVVDVPPGAVGPDTGLCHGQRAGARPTRPARTRWPWPPCAALAWSGSRPMTTWW